MPDSIGATKTSWPLRNGGRGNPTKKDTYAHHPKDPKDFDDAVRRFEKDLKGHTDVARRLSHAILLGNQHAIYRSLSRQLRKGNHKAFSVLCNRAFGMPQQELSFDPARPFKLEIEVIGMRQPVTIEGEKAELKKLEE